MSTTFLAETSFRQGMFNMNDPQPLHAALKWERYRLPVLDDVLPELKDAKVFSKLDVREAYWHVRLDEPSSKLTTMITATVERCSEQNIILNEEKQQTRLKEIVFHSHKITSEGVKADKTKVEALHNMSSPTYVEGIRLICGMAQYMSRFIPDLAGTLEPIRALTRKGVPFVSSKECENAFDTLKKNLSELHVWPTMIYPKNW